MRTRMIAVEKAEDIARNAVLGGYGNVKTFRDTGMVRRHVELLCSMDCTHPYQYEMHARYSAQHGKRVKPLTIVVNTRCRKCPECRKRRAMFWQARAVTEWGQAPVSWFGTLTFRPDVDAYNDALARVELWERGVAFDELSDEEKFRARVRIAGQRITRYIKRLREGDVRRGKPDFRYLLVAEAHKGEKTSAEKWMQPHFHVLFHEQDKEGGLVLPGEIGLRADGSVRADRYGNPLVADTAFLKQQWQDGFSNFAKCCTPQAASYLCKYLTKDDASVRIRASFKYGKRDVPPAARPSRDPEVIDAANSTPPKEEDLHATHY